MRYDATANAIEATGLVKRFGKTTALDWVDLVARPGRVLGVLGPNGAGKTTAVRILATLLRPDSGRVSVCGGDVQRDPHQVRQFIGLTGQYAAVDEGLTGTKNHIKSGRLLGMPRADARARARELLDRFELTEAAARPAKTYSGGMRRRLDLAASLVGNPRVLYLDEPTTGLDPLSRTDDWGMVRELVADGVTVLLTSQYLDEADQLAHDIVVFDHGRVVATGTPDQLKAKTGGQVLQVAPADRARMAEVTALMTELIRGEVGTEAENGVATAQVGDSALVRHVFRQRDDSGVEVQRFALRKPSMDEVFFSLTGRRASDENRDENSDEDSGTRELEGSTR